MTLNSVTYGDITIAGQQAQPPAGHDDIAFRPACTQLSSTLIDSGIVEHAINLPDGQVRILATYEQMPIDKAYLYLDAEGLCKTGPDAIAVPIIYADQLPQQSVVTGTTTPSSIAPNQIDPVTTPGTGGLGGLILGALGLAVIGGIFYLTTQRQPQTAKPPPKVEPPTPEAKPNSVDDLTSW